MNKLYVLIVFILLCKVGLNAQYYFPPLTGEEWETMSLAEAGFQDQGIAELHTFLEETDTKGFMLLKNGKIVIESYYNDHDAAKPWYWASAGKSLTAVLVGIAEQEGHLSINDFTKKYLGDQWTSCDTESVKIVHQLTMTSGFDYTVPNIYCTEPACFECLNPPGTEWFYHNGPYTILDSVMLKATGVNYNLYTKSRVLDKIGMQGLWVKADDNNVFFSNTRSFARFGLLALNGGVWNNDRLLNETYFNKMVNTSQDINPSYGYLWWLNGKDKVRLPGLTFNIPGPLFSQAPSDMFAALGKDGQICMVVPSMDLVIVRMGIEPSSTFIATAYVNDIWEKLRPIISNVEYPSLDTTMDLYPNPTTDLSALEFTGKDQIKEVKVYGAMGQLLFSGQQLHQMQYHYLPSGVYFIELHTDKQYWRKKVIKQ